MARRTVAAPVITCPEMISVASYPVPGCSVADPFAVDNTGTMALNLSAGKGQVATPSSPAAQAIRIDKGLAGINAELAGLQYIPTNPPSNDSIVINVWNQAGVESTKLITVMANGSVVPPEPIPPDPGPDPIPPDPGVGVQAYRIGDFLRTAGGANMFPSMDENNVWGSWPADYRPDTVLAALDWMLNGSKNIPISRVYVYGGDRLSLLQQWMPLIADHGHRFTASVAANGGENDADAVLTLARDPRNGIVQIEGVNEPNTNFGSGEVPVAQTKRVQDMLWNGRPNNIPCAGPSIVYGLPFPEGYIVPGYCSQDDMNYLTARMDVANAHFYPPNVCDLDDGSGRGGAFADVMEGMRIVYGDKPVSMTEYQPTLYGVSGTNDTLDGYYTPIMLLSAFRLGVSMMNWYPLFDYATAHPCGFFPQNASNPRPSAYSIRALHTLACDNSSDALTFEPRKLDYSVSGGQGPINPASPKSGTQHVLFDGADGVFRLFIYNEQIQPGGDDYEVTIEFGSTIKSIVEYEIRPNANFDRPIQQDGNITRHRTWMNATTRLFLIER